MINGHTVVDLELKRHHDELREHWPARALLHLDEKRDYALFAVLLSVLAHSYGDAMITLMHVCFPGFKNIRPPFYASAGKVMKGGEIAADLVQADHSKVRNALVFKDMDALQAAFRKLADEMRLSDDDRAAMFVLVKKWVVADFRLDPNRKEAA